MKHENKLINAVCENDTESVREALKAGADVNAKNEYGNTALILSACNGYTEIAKILRDAGAK